jgi:hypothetical protein
MGISMREIANGTKAALSALAHLGGVEYDVLWASALRRSGAGIACGDNRFDRTFVRPKARLAICPACIQPDGANRIAAYEKTAWRFTPIRTCPLHDHVLVDEVVKPEAQLSPYDFHCRIERFIGQPELTRHREATGLERYITSRLAEGFEGGTPWLDAMSIQIVAEASEHLGVLEKFGADTARSSLTDDQLHEAGGVGFGILTEGPAAFQRCLKDSMIRHPGGSNALAANIAFCEHLYHWLDKTGGADQPCREMKNLIRELMLCSRPLSADDRIFGEPVGERRLYSLYQAAKLCGMHTTRLRRLLRIEGVLDDTQQKETPQKTVFPVNPQTTRLLNRLRGSIPLASASRYIGAPRLQFDLLRKAGLINPVVRDWGRPHLQLA